MIGAPLSGFADSRSSEWPLWWLDAKVPGEVPENRKKYEVATIIEELTTVFRRKSSRAA
jgi:hypothetical protein